MQSFVEMFMDFTNEYESPGSFFKWAAYATVAATLRDNVYLQQGHKKAYPNIYIILLASSAVHRKSVPTSLAGELVREVGNTKIIQGRASIQAVIDELAGVTQNKYTGEILRGGSCLICAEELASFVIQDDSTLPILTDLYDAREEWTDNLRGKGKSTIRNLCVSMIAASNDTFLKEVYTERAVYGGLLGRTFVVNANEFRKANALIRNEKEKYDKKPLIESLRPLTKLKGEYRLDTGVAEEYTKWYTQIRNASKDKFDRTGSLGRIHTGVLKLSMILGAAHNYDSIIKMKDLEEAIAICLDVLPNSNLLALGKGRSTTALASGLLVETLFASKDYKMSQRDIMFIHWQDFDSDTLTTIVNTLEQAGMISTMIVGKSTEYSLTGRALELMQNGKAKGRGI